MEVACAAGVRRLVLTHHDPSHDDPIIADIERRARAVVRKRGSPMDVSCTREGGEIVLHGERLATVSEPASGATEGHTAAGLRLLAVDDDVVLRTLTVTILSRMGYAITEAADGREALQLIDREPPDLVILDLDMPETSGLEVLRHLRSRAATADLPILILTGSADEATTRAAFEAGATDYLTKPFSIPQLVARVQTWLERGRSG